jgi:hypothetical protein
MEANAKLSLKHFRNFIYPMTAKELVIHALRKLPEETSIEEILEEIEILAAIQKGEDAAEAGRVVPHEEVKSMFASWNTK